MGVKQLWTLVKPVGRPVMLETLEGKVLAIDSSIWLYQFQATMRDTEGKALTNAHILGFFRRICKLLFYGIRPVFVFDGGAPVLKRSTINERRRKKSGAAVSHAKVAEKLLAAQLRREALNHVERAGKPVSGKPVSRKASGSKKKIDDNTVYLEDLIGSNEPITPYKPKNADGSTTVEPSPHSSQKKRRGQEYDPYHLPEVDFDAKVASASAALDPRLATEEELRAFIEEMRPEDFDTGSEAFRELPAEVQYEIIGDLRLRSRQTSHQRLQSMLEMAPTPIDFSMAQIKHLQERNALTQQLLTTVDTMGKANVLIPTRIASERNRVYTLVKNEGADGGWVLGIKDEGTKAKPIRVYENEEGEGESDDDDMEDVPIPIRPQAPLPPPPPALKPAQHYDLESPTRRVTFKSSSGKGKGRAEPLFENVDEVEMDDPEMTLAIAESLETVEDEELQRAIQLSMTGSSSYGVGEPGSSRHSDSQQFTMPVDDDDDLYFPESPKLSQTTLSVPDSVSQSVDADIDGISELAPAADQLQNATATVSSSSVSLKEKEREVAAPLSPTKPAGGLRFGLSLLLQPGLDSQATAVGTPAPLPTANFMGHTQSKMKPPVLPFASPSPSAAPIESSFQLGGNDEGGEMENITLSDPTHLPVPQKTVGPSPDIHEVSDDSEDDMEDVAVASHIDAGSESKLQQESQDVALPDPIRTPTPQKTPAPPADTQRVSDDSDDDMEEVVLPPAPANVDSGLKVQVEADMSGADSPVHAEGDRTAQEADVISVDTPARSNSPMTLNGEGDGNTGDAALLDASAPTLHSVSGSASPRPSPPSPPPARDDDVHSEEEFFSDWSRSPSPTYDGEAGPSQRAAPPAEDWDAAQEMDPEAEEGEFARFMSQVKGRDIASVRQEIDEEIQTLNKVKRAAMRDAEDITQQMISQIKVLLRLFGIPYITAPMEAEAQCATLVSLGLVEGIITDDSDAFLFGGLRIFKNMFNQSKTVECFLTSDLSRELGLDRDKLIRLAYLLGSDYVDGLPGVGPVVAMELLTEFSGEDGLHKFKDWWQKVQTGRDTAADTSSPFRKRFKKKFKTLHITDEWPNPQVRDAYYHPTVDESEEPFKWGLPDLSGLREFMYDELSWPAAKVDETLLPIIRKVGQRGKAVGANKQATLNNFFDVSIGAGTYAPRPRQAYASKRLQKIVTDFRKEQKRPEDGGDDNGEDESAAPTSGEKEPAEKKKGGKGKGKAKTSATKAPTKSARGGSTSARGGGKRKSRANSDKAGTTKKQKVSRQTPSNDESRETIMADVPAEMIEEQDAPPALRAKLRPRPKPRIRKKAVEDDADEQEESGDSADEFFITRRRG
ncbi:hypothetical protein BOTBODRAFT_32808 [Botryobasidium botryosum FD-172 SS1]|uniref:PIN domain-like protein n=1 Tax=Botryobasidium botryosum (strain FD-172 SS1) TaxID=930990 RepID=A0A067MFS6_BOTB1|nr:hypothetical protein BOTBODRAFT_32808 [Botryobasidium botryosum FD-172 SS1]